ncbi:MAG: hypothetical protein C0173_10110 [Desulfurella sp.]|uniref:hypothetical protein n=1 Tax=Desulfurella sp. TaxID=1962857 RepID=UPI000CB19F95|nr:hypothetical protein [Desulfurella sp.]PMP87092.1 MAG: hypothetical protein C0173_10110 [Desulfurella sp.]
MDKEGHNKLAKIFRSCFLEALGYKLEPETGVYHLKERTDIADELFFGEPMPLYTIIFDFNEEPRIGNPVLECKYQLLPDMERILIDIIKELENEL